MEKNLDDEMTGEYIEAFIDGELGENEEQVFLGLLAEDVDLRMEYKKLFRQKLLLNKWWDAQIR